MFTYNILSDSAMRLNLSLFFVLLFLSSCNADNKEISISGNTMGTQYHVKIINSPGKSLAYLKDEIDLLLTRINQQMSTYIADSEISQFNRHVGTDWFPVSSDLAFVISTALTISEETSGAFDVTVAPLIDLWGFGVKVKTDPPDESEIKTTLNNIGYQFLNARTQPAALRKLKPELKIDLSAIAKGFAVDKVAELLAENGYENYLVEIGGEIRVKGQATPNSPWKIGIEVPNSDKRKVKEYLLLSDFSLATSGDYRNYFVKDGVRYSHTIDPKTGEPVEHNLASVTVLHRSAMIADAYATALLVMGRNKAIDFVKSIKEEIRVHLITRQGSSFKNWQNIDEIKIPWVGRRCELDQSNEPENSKNWGGCIYSD